MKKFGLLFAVLVMSFMFAVSVSAEQWEDYDYKILEDGTVEITAYNGTAEEITIPSEINGKMVTSIGSGGYLRFIPLNKLTIPSTIKNIKYTAFLFSFYTANIVVDECNEFYSNDEYGVLFNKDKSVLVQYPRGNERTLYVIPDSVITIEKQAFNNCHKLESITIGSSVETIDDSTFSICFGLKEINVDPKNKLFSTDEYGVLFNKDKSILLKYPAGSTRTAYTIPKGVITIGDSAFYEIANLINVDIPTSVTSIGNEAFAWCEKLESITIPDKVTYIGTEAFYWCRNLNSVSIGNSVYYIGPKAFYYCENLINVHIPASVTYVSASAFLDCLSLKNITVDKNNKNYSNDDFGVLFNKDMSLLIKYPTGNARKSYNIPDSVKLIEEWSFGRCKSLTNITIGNSVTTIRNFAFNECSNLLSVTIPNSVITIEANVFYYCKNLADIYYNGTESQWKNIVIDSDNEDLTNANIHCHTHSHNAVVTPPTCTEQGYTTYTCECGDTYVADYVNANGHTFTNYVSDGKATCTTDGTKTAKCDNCDAIDSVTEKGGHSFSDKWIIDEEPSCTDVGSKSHHCLYCDEKNDVTPMGKLAHTYNMITINPTCTDKGYYVYTCNCGDNYRETIPAKGHTFDGSACTNCDYDKADDCPCDCHAGGIKGFFFKIKLFFWKLFKKNPVCECSAIHY